MGQYGDCGTGRGQKGGSMVTVGLYRVSTVPGGAVEYCETVLSVYQVGAPSPEGE